MNSSSLVVRFAKTFVLLTGLNYLVGNNSPESLLTIIFLSVLIVLVITILWGEL